VQLAAKLREQEEALRRREVQFSIRQKQLEIIHQDIRTERTTIDQLRKQVDDETKALNDKAAALEKKAMELDMQRQQSANQTNDLRRTMAEYETVESDRVKQMAAMYDTMPPENAAKILQNLIDTGTSDIAVKILSSMKERQAARVLAEFRDPATAAQLLERLKGLKRPAPAGAAPAGGKK
jgi:flagellar motility protein MotE (MotC chaperone)